MAGWEPWDIGLLLVAAYIAVVTLVRMMVRRRDKLLDDLSRRAHESPRRQPKSSGNGKRNDAA